MLYVDTRMNNSNPKMKYNTVISFKKPQIFKVLKILIFKSLKNKLLYL